MGKHNSKEIFFVGLFFGLIFVMGWFLWDEINENSDDVLNKLEKSKSTKIISTPNIVTQNNSTATLPKADSVVEEKIEEVSETSLADGVQSDQEEIESDPKDAVDTWNQYKDKQDKFTLRYPATVLVEIDGEAIKVSATDEELKIKRYSNEDGNELDAWYQKQFSEKERKNCVLTSGDLKVGRHETRLAKADSTKAECDKAGYFFFDNSKKLVLRIESEKEITSQMKKILETFEFNND